MSQAVRIWEDNFKILMKIRSKSERNSLLFALISYGFSGKTPQDLKLNENNLILFEVMKNNFIAKNQGGRPSEKENSFETVSKPLSENRKQKTENIIQSSDKSSDCIAASRQTKKYAFEGKIIKLNSEDFQKWQQAFPDLNLNAELLQRDNWLQGEPPDVQKKWFISTPQFFIKQNERRKAQHDEIVSNENSSERWYL